MADFPRVIAPCGEERSRNVFTFSPEDLPHVGKLSPRNLGTNVGDVVKHHPYVLIFYVLFFNLTHVYAQNPSYPPMQ